MSAVEIEQTTSDLAEQPFNAANFPYAFVEAFGNKETTIKPLRAGASNKSDLGGVLQTNKIHIATCDPGEVTKTLKALKDSQATAKAKAKFILADRPPNRGRRLGYPGDKPPQPSLRRAAQGQPRMGRD